MYRPAPPTRPAHLARRIACTPAQPPGRRDGGVSAMRRARSDTRRIAPHTASTCLASWVRTLAVAPRDAHPGSPLPTGKGSEAYRPRIRYIRGMYRIDASQACGACLASARCIESDARAPGLGRPLCAWRAFRVCVGPAVRPSGPAGRQSSRLPRQPCEERGSPRRHAAPHWQL